MPTPLFLLQIVEVQTGAVVRLPSGGALERDLVAFCTEAIVAKGVGFFRTEAQVRVAIDAGITEAIRAFTLKTREVVR